MSDQPAPPRPCPPDGGSRAWVVMFASFFCNGVIFGVINCYSVIYVELQKKLQEDSVTDASSKAALVGSLTIGTTFFLSPIAGILTDKIGIRLTTFIGGLLATGGMFISSFCTHSVVMLYITYGVLFGVGASMAYTPSLVILGHYFHRYMGLVNGFVTAGSSVFTMIMPYLIDLLLRRYGLDICLRVLALFMSVIMVSALLYKPIPQSSEPEDKSGFKSFINTQIWRQRKYVVWALAIPVALFGYFVPYVHMVKFVKDNYPEGDGKSLVFCIGVASGTGRLVFGRIADNPRVNRVFLQQLSFLSIGLLTMLMTVSPSFFVLQLIALGMGLFDGCFISLLGPIAFDLCGQDGAGQAIGFLLGFCSLPLTVGPPIAGLIYDETGSYTLPFLLAGIPPVVCACVLCLVHYTPQQSPHHAGPGPDLENQKEDKLKTDEVPPDTEFNALLHINTSNKDIVRKKVEMPKKASSVVLDATSLNLRVGRIIFIQEHPFCDHVYVNHIHLGRKRERISISRLRPFYTRKELMNKLVVVVCNIKHKVKKLDSPSFILFAKSTDKNEILIPPESSEAGDRVLIEGYPFQRPKGQQYIRPMRESERVMNIIINDFQVNSEGRADYRGTPLLVGEGFYNGVRNKHSSGELVLNNPVPKKKCDISRLDLRVGLVSQAEVHPIFKEYFLITLLLGNRLMKRSVSHLAPNVDVRQLRDLKLVVCCNIQGKVKGYTSDCFVVYAKSGKDTNFLEVPGKAQPGDRVYVPGYPFDPLRDWPFIPDGQSVFRQAVRRLTVNSDGIAKYRGTFMRTIQEGFVCTCEPYPRWKFKI